MTCNIHNADDAVGRPFSTALVITLLALLCIDDTALFLDDKLVGPHRLARAVNRAANDLEVRLLFDKSEVWFDSFG